jgi:hypothetical protein
MGQPKYQRDGDARTSGPGFGITWHDRDLGGLLHGEGHLTWLVLRAGWSDFNVAESLRQPSNPREEFERLVGLKPKRAECD